MFTQQLFNDLRELRAALIAIGTILLFPYPNGTALSQGEPQAESIHSYVQALNTPTSLETAASHGYSGFTLGVGALRIQPDVEFSRASVPAQDSQSFDLQSPFLIPNIWVTKGLFWPVDIGINYGYLEDQQIRKLGAYLQWSVYQEFLRPAVAIRLDYSELTAPGIFSALSSGINAVLSWGYGPLSLLASGGLLASKSILAEQSGVAFGLVEPYEEGLREGHKTARRYSYGLQVQIPASPISITAENIALGPQNRAIAGKISVGI